VFYRVSSGKPTEGISKKKGKKGDAGEGFWGWVEIGPEKENLMHARDKRIKKKNQERDENLGNSVGVRFAINVGVTFRRRMNRGAGKKNWMESQGNPEMGDRKKKEKNLT